MRTPEAILDQLNKSANPLEGAASLTMEELGASFEAFSKRDQTKTFVALIFELHKRELNKCKEATKQPTPEEKRVFHYGTWEAATKIGTVASEDVTARHIELPPPAILEAICEVWKAWECLATPPLEITIRSPSMVGTSFENAIVSAQEQAFHVALTELVQMARETKNL